MSIVLLGPRRVYMMLLVWQRLVDRHDSRPVALARTESALAATIPSPHQHAEPMSRFVLSARLHRVIRRRLIGLTVLVLEQSRNGR